MSLIIEYLVRRSASLPRLRFSGKRIRQNLGKVRAMQRRDRRLRRISLSVIFFPS